MKKTIFVLILTVFMVVTQFWGCDKSSVINRIKGSGNIIDIQYDFNNFERIDVSNAFEISIIKSDTFEVALWVDDNIKNYLEVQHTGNLLIIDLENGHNYDNVNLKAVIQMPEIESFRGSGAIVTEMSGFSPTDTLENFDLELSGASVFSCNMDVGSCIITLSGASVLHLTGNCSNLYLEASGASELTMGNFVISTANFMISGACDGTIHVTGHLDVMLSGASILRYYGNPEMGNLNITGASSLIKL